MEKFEFVQFNVLLNHIVWNGWLEFTKTSQLLYFIIIPRSTKKDIAHNLMCFLIEDIYEKLVDNIPKQQNFIQMGKLEVRAGRIEIYWIELEFSLYFETNLINS